MNIVISGSSRGIGYELVKILSQKAENKLFLVSRNETKLKALKLECLKDFGFANIELIPGDITLFEEYPNMLAKLPQRIDLLINNAGFLVKESFSNITLDQYDAVFDTNIKAPFFIIQSLLDKFSAGAHILNISSMGGVQGSVKFPGLAAYSSSKGALAILTESLAEELKELDIKINCLALGAAQTEMLNEAFPGYKAPVSSKEMAEFIAQFALNGHKYFNGKVLPVALSTP